MVDDPNFDWDEFERGNAEFERSMSDWRRSWFSRLFSWLFTRKGGE